jgi:hypothetical protein
MVPGAWPGTNTRRISRLSDQAEQSQVSFRVARVGRGRWQVVDVARETLVATFDGWRAARDHAKHLTLERASGTDAGTALPPAFPA